MSGAVQPVQGTGAQPGSETDDFWTQKGTQTATGGVLGGVLGPIVERGVMPAVNRGINWARGVVNPAYQKIVELGDRFDVRLSAPEITMSPTGKRLRPAWKPCLALATAPFGAPNNSKSRGAAEGQVEGLQQELQAPPGRDLAAVEQAARGTGQRAKEARILLAEINDAGNDWGRVVQTQRQVESLQ